MLLLLWDDQEVAAAARVGGVGRKGKREGVGAEEILGYHPPLLPRGFQIH